MAKIKKIVIKANYYKYYNRNKIKDNTILIQFNDELYNIVIELCGEKYREYKKYIAVSKNKEDKIKELIKEKNLLNTKAVCIETNKYSKLLATSKYLVNNSNFPLYFIKKEGQIYLNIVSNNKYCSILDDPVEMGNTQRNFIMSNYLLFKDNSTYKKMIEDFMIKNYYSGKYIIGDYNLSEIICNYVFNGKKDNKITVIDGREVSNKKENILIFPGGFAKNGITTALRGLINLVDKDKYNFILAMYATHIELNKDSIKEYVCTDYIPIKGKYGTSLFELLISKLNDEYNMRNKFINKIMDRIYRRESRRLFGDIKLKYVVHYTGYETAIMNIFRNMDAKKAIYIHNDMAKEIKAGKAINEKDYRRTLESYDKIVCIRETSRNEILKFEPNLDPKKVVLAHNVNDVESIRNKAKEEIVFQEITECNIKLDELKRILNDKSKTKFINIGRFSEEKGQERLINAFKKFAKEDKNSYLIIIGGYGPLYEKIKELVNDSERIILISSINNPFPILNKCDSFVLSSFYEGLPMTIMEALILDKIVLSTNIPGPREFLEKGYGILLPNSEDGIYNGFVDFKKGILKPKVKFDAEKFNKDALNEFYKVIDK